MIPTDLQKTITDWFQYREVVDDDKFEVYFKRVLNRDYGRYQELLRIEPGYAHYDWLVKNYKERTYDTDSTENEKQDITANETRTKTANNNSSEVVDGTKTTGKTFNDARTEKTTLSGKDTLTNTGTSKNDGTNTVNEKTTPNTTIETTDSRESTNNEESSTTTTTTGDKTTNETDTGFTSIAELGKTLPQETSGSVKRMLITDTPGFLIQPINVLTGLDTETFSSYQEQGNVSGRNNDTTEQRNEDSTVEGTNNKTINDSGTKTEKETGTITSEGTTNFENTLTNDLTNETSYGKIEDVVYGGNTSEDQNEKQDKTTTLQGTTEENANKDNTSNKSIEKTSSFKTKEIYTGRDMEPAAMLQKAVDFITATSAWAWLQNRLEVCFMAIYDI